MGPVVRVSCAVQTVQEFLEKNYTADLEEDAAIQLAVSALMEVVEAGHKHIEVGIVKKEQFYFLDEDRLEKEVCSTVHCFICSLGALYTRGSRPQIGTRVGVVSVAVAPATYKCRKLSVLLEQPHQAQPSLGRNFLPPPLSRSALGLSPVLRSEK